METFLYVIFFISCIVMVVSVLLQPGKTDAGALFTSGVSSSAMKPRGTASVLSKLTIITATIFMLSALLLTLPALTGKVSVLDTQAADTPASSTTESDDKDESNTDSKEGADKDDDSSSDEKKEESKSDEEKPKSEEKSEEKTDDKKDEAKEKTEDKKEESK